MNKTFFESALLLLFNNKVEPTFRYPAARDIKYICSDLMKDKHAKKYRFFSKDNVEFLYQLATRCVDRELTEQTENDVLAIEKYSMFIEVVEAAKKKFIKPEQVSEHYKNIRLYKKYIYINNNIEPIQEFINKYKERSFNSVKEVVENYKSKVEGLYKSLTELSDKQSTEMHLNLSNLTRADSRNNLIGNLVNYFDLSKMFPTGYEELDDALGGGLESTRLYLLAANPGGGKSAVMLNIAYNIAKTLKERNSKQYVLYITLENLTSETVARTMSIHTLKEYKEIKKIFRNGKKHLEKDAELNEALKDLGKLPLDCFYYPSYSISTGDISSLIQLMIHERGEKPAIVIVDYLDLIQNNEEVDIRHKLGQIVAALKNTAVHFQLPVLTATQFVKAAYNSEVPEIGDVSETSKKIEFSDVVILLKNLGDKILFIFGKNRGGAAGIKFPLRFERAKLKLWDMNENKDNNDIDTELIGDASIPAFDLKNVYDASFDDIDIKEETDPVTESEIKIEEQIVNEDYFDEEVTKSIENEKEADNAFFNILNN